MIMLFENYNVSMLSKLTSLKSSNSQDRYQFLIIQSYFPDKMTLVWLSS
jgi:hypothetical protein